jgi:hypothetical protein
MAVYGGPFDLTIDFAYRVRPEDEPDTQVRVTMSWEHALATAKALLTLVDGYQEQVGPLPDLEKVREEAP